jgi:predicted ATP-dependent endonuclease of OLD family
MEIEAIRVQNFRCVRDSGKIAFNSGVTFLIGENESGKSAILDALTHFNYGQKIQDVDICRRSAIMGHF